MPIMHTVDHRHILLLYKKLKCHQCSVASDSQVMSLWYRVTCSQIWHQLPGHVWL